MNEKIIMAPTGASEFKFTINNIDYEIRVLDYSHVGTYAKVLIKDLTNEESYVSDGFITINNITIYTNWNIEYDRDCIDNFICGKELVVRVTY